MDTENLSSAAPVRVRDIMSPQPVTVRADAPLATVARLLARHAITAVPVVDDHGRVVGVLSEADVLRHDRMGDPAMAVMGTVVALVHPETELAELRRILGTTLVKSVPVVDAADHVVGMVSRSDVVRDLVGHEAGDGPAVEQ
ncbi:putative transcriptional regulator, contains C-terminal CBS domains [Nocardioides sp. J9]|uniref:CBS domain-containing protein n=1 Tax=Nocardioides sp. J9 TaxID=935844 RepID=UPI0011A1FAFC|nr:CBS domain-containing protein [Nocardioides sp. J9]TWG97816.1 putative transcriptional regulator, contains C-terminal CBS domains [Nocardioides sp. J9]